MRICVTGEGKVPIQSRHGGGGATAVFVPTVSLSLSLSLSSILNHHLAAMARGAAVVEGEDER